MNTEKKPSRRWCAGVLALVSLPWSVAGCNSFLNSWLDPSQVGSFTRETTLDIRTSLSIQDTPSGIVGATDPRPEDLIPIYEEYRFVPGDVLSIRIFELLARNTETSTQATVDEIGTVILPVLGQVRVAGLTRSEIARELVDLLDKRGIIREATVIVEPVVRRGQTFVVFGSTASPNLYPLPRPNTTLLEALNIAGGFPDLATDVYVIRDEGAEHGAAIPGPAHEGNLEKFVASDHDRGIEPAVALSDGGRGVTAGASSLLAYAALNDEGAPGDEPQPTTRNAEAQAELIEAVAAPAGTDDVPPAPTTRRGTEEIPPTEPTGQPRWIFLNGQWIETTTGPVTQPVEPVAPEAPEAPEEVETVMPQIDWERLAGERERRIIRISARGLRDGDYRQNIIVRGGDVIRVLAGQVGEYYMMGQVARPGAYSITGRQVTLKSAIAAAGNLAPLAWPDRCTIYRRYGDREEMHQVNLDAIFAGKESDIMLKNNDLVLVGTHPAAPFLAVIRNAFRMTYGFGFVWDRNFADIESFGGKINPANRPPTPLPNLFR